jgi:hypothetical protein
MNGPDAQIREQQLQIVRVQVILSFAGQGGLAVAPHIVNQHPICRSKKRDLRLPHAAVNGMGMHKHDRVVRCRVSKITVMQLQVAMFK